LIFLIIIAAVLIVIYVNHLVDLYDVDIFRRRRRSELDPWKELTNSNSNDEPSKKD